MNVIPYLNEDPEKLLHTYLNHFKFYSHCKYIPRILSFDRGRQISKTLIISKIVMISSCLYQKECIQKDYIELERNVSTIIY